MPQHQWMRKVLHADKSCHHHTMPRQRRGVAMMRSWKTLALVTTVGMALAVVDAPRMPAFAQGKPSSAPVEVTNTPLPVNTGTESNPFQQAVSTDSTTDPFLVFTIAAPEGKTLVVDQVSARASVPSGQAVKGTVTCQGQDLGLADHSLIFNAQGTFGGVSVFAATHAMRCFAAGTRGILFGIQRNSSTGAMTNIEVSISGHLRP